MDNLNELNTILFETLRGVKDGTIDDKKANVITNVSNSIINNAKTQLSAYKLTKGVAYSETFGKPSQKVLESKDKYEQMNEFAMMKGYDSVSQAMEKIGKNEFNKLFSNWIKQ